MAAATTAEAINITWVCHAPKSSRSRGIYYGENPMKFATTVLMAQLSVAALLSNFLQFLLTPFGESAFISMMLAGFALGPSLWGDNNKIIEALYPAKSFNINETVCYFGCMIYLFVIGCKIDVNSAKNAGRLAVIIGFLVFLIPLLLNLIVAKILKSSMQMEPSVSQSIYHIAVLESLSSFHVIACLLGDLKLLNSEIGRLALTAAPVNGTLSYVFLMLVLFTKQNSVGTGHTMILMIFSAVFIVMFIGVVLKPIMYWMIRNTPEGSPIKDNYIFSIMIMLMGCAFLSEILGQHMLFGAAGFGMAMPEGPPLGSSIVSKFEIFFSNIMLPSYFVYTVSGVNLFAIHSTTFIVIIVLSVTSFVGKVLAAMLPSLYCNVIPVDAFALGLIMGTQGIFEVILAQHAKLLTVLDVQTYSVIVIVMVLLSGVAAPIIKAIYQPSQRYLSCKKRTIQNSSSDSELRVLACIYHQDYTPSIISLLEVSNPTQKCPICCYIVHLIELNARLTPLFLHHRPGKRASYHSHDSSHIVNAFRSYERHSDGKIMANLYTAVSPFASVHEDICRLAQEKRTSIVIIPFHRQYKIHGVENETKVQGVNRHILSNAPCSIGIFVDRGTLTGLTSKNNPLCNVGVIFLQGKDDREALAYALRMAKHPNVGVNMIRVIEPNQKANYYSLDMELDNNIIAEFKIVTYGKKHHRYTECFVNDSVELIGMIRSLEYKYDLILVGRQHNGSIQLLSGLSDWNEFPELGYIGDMLASLDSGCEASVLVVQQKMNELEESKLAQNYPEDNSIKSVKVPFVGGNQSNRVWPIV